ncbi:MAG: MgtC/SapB family protein [Planctomycetes bacterium]|nr:MgtC/SapB family protein [Planctomycetota bacterium]
MGVMLVYIEYALKILAAGLSGAIIGWERELKEKGAGLRTHILIAIGACLFSLIALNLKHDFPDGDILRLLHSMLLAVGFIGGGVIFTRRGSVQGLTTAAGLWVLTAVGTAIGLGYYFLGVFVTIISIFIIAWMKRCEDSIHRDKESENESEDV